MSARNPKRLDGAAAAKLPPCPEHLQGEARRECRRLGRRLIQCGLFADIDAGALAIYCQAWGRWVQAEEALKQYGVVVKSPSGYPMQSPYLAIANKAMDLMTRLLVEFGMSPSSRSRVSASWVPPVVPDSEAADARARRWSRERAREAYRRGPTAPVVHPPGLDMDFGAPSKIDEVVGRLKETLREGIEEQWRQLRAVELVLAEVAEEFDGEDPALPDVRHVLDQTTEKLAELHTEAQRYAGPFELAEPGEDEVTSVRGIVERAGVRLGGQLPVSVP